MHMRFFFYLCLLSFINAFSFNIDQGILENGMRYYLHPSGNEKVHIHLCFKTPQKYARFPSIDLLASIPYKYLSLANGGFTRGSYGHTVNGITSEKSPQECLEVVSEILNADTFPEIVRALRDEYEDLLEERGEGEEVAEEYLCFLYGEESINDIFSRDDAFLGKIVHSFLEPSRMCLFIEGSFDSEIIKLELEKLFGGIQSSGILIDSFDYKPQRPFAFTVKAPFIADMFFCAEEPDYSEGAEQLIQETSFYYFDIKPSFKNAVLKDLLLLSLFGKDSKSSITLQAIGELSPRPVLPYLNELSEPQLDPILFAEFKKKLKEVYHDYKAPVASQCLLHFLSGISDQLLLNNQNLISELEQVTLEDLNNFIKQHIDKTVRPSRTFTFDQP